MGFRSRLMLVSCVLAARTALAADWAAYQSENFVVYSDAPEGEALRTVREFEIFRQVCLLMLNLPDEPEVEALRIFVMDRPLDFNRIVANRDAGGIFYHSVYGPRMIVGPGPSERSRSTLFHEYVHYLMHSRFSVNYPTWYSEGIAELLGAVEIKRSSIVVGTSPEYYQWNPMPVRDVIVRKHDRILSDFYQTSFLLVHHLLIESYEEPTRAQQTADYIRRYDAGEDPIEAFVTSYGMSPKEMEDEIDTRFTAITLDRDRFEYDGELARRELEPGEDLYVLGDIAVELSQFEAVDDYFDSFDELEEESSFANHVSARRAIAYIHQDRVAEGDATIATLLAADPTDADVIADIAHYAYDRFVHAAGNNEDGVREHLRRSIEFGQRAVAANPADLEALYYLGLSYESNGDLQLAADTLLESYDRNPSVPSVNLSLARVLIKGRQIDLASYLISRVYSSTHSEETRARLEQIQSLIQADDFDIDSVNELL